MKRECPLRTSVEGIVWRERGGRRIMRNNRFRYSHGKLVSWTLDRCEICAKFLAKRQKKYCSVHGKSSERVRRYEETVRGRETRCAYGSSDKGKEVRRNIQRRLYHTNKENRERQKLKGRIRQNPDRFSVGDYV